MGRKQFSLVLQEQQQLYYKAKNHPFSSEAKEWSSPTLDPVVSWARRTIDPDAPQAVTEFISSPTISTPQFATQYNSLPSTPELLPPSLVSPLLPSHLVPSPDAPPRQHLETNSRNTSRVILSRVEETINIFPVLLTCPVVYADAIGQGYTRTSRFAILGPQMTGILWPGRTLRLAHALNEEVTLLKNHGSSLEKPGCLVIEAQYMLDSFTFPRILLAPSYLLHTSFEEESDPYSFYVGDGQGFQLHDHITDNSGVPHYGIAPATYFRVQPQNSESNINGRDEEEIDSNIGDAQSEGAES
ncbi:hypothetical protein B0H13DRAFT_1929836 [Mycena leptocephala]|nr:hypothetical protein B0H13DRAFT_1929836 [Mycena leptocephala]